MRVTIAVEGVLREIEVRPDLLAPGMGEWQDATEMDLLRAFGSAYREAAAMWAAAVAPVPTTSEEVEVAVEPVAEQPVESVAGSVAAPLGEVAVEPVAAELTVAEAPVVTADLYVGGEEDLYAAIEPVVEPVVEETPFAAAPVEFAPVPVYTPSEDDAAAFLPPEGEHAATVAPVATHCSCGHGIAWHPVSLDTAEPGDCQMVWPIDDHEPDGPASRCSCLRFAPAVAGPTD